MLKLLNNKSKTSMQYPNPFKAGSLACVSAAVMLTVAGCQTSQTQPPAGATSSPSASASTPAPAPTSETAHLPIPVHILAGYDTDMDLQGVKWIRGSAFFPDGSVIERPDITIETTANSGPAGIYKAERYSMTKFTYGPIENGDYVVKLHFCETFEGITGNGGRVFSLCRQRSRPGGEGF